MALLYAFRGGSVGDHQVRQASRDKLRYPPEEKRGAAAQKSRNGRRCRERPSDMPPLWREDGGPFLRCQASLRWIGPLESTNFETGDPLPQLQRVANLKRITD